MIIEIGRKKERGREKKENDEEKKKKLEIKQVKRMTFERERISKRTGPVHPDFFFFCLEKKRKRIFSEMVKAPRKLKIELLAPMKNSTN